MDVVQRWRMKIELMGAATLPFAPGRGRRGRGMRSVARAQRIRSPLALARRASAFSEQRGPGGEGYSLTISLIAAAAFSTERWSVLTTRSYCVGSSWFTP